MRQALYVCVLVVVFLVVNASVAHAATGGDDSADLLAPLNIRSSEGVPIDGYELSANGGSIVSLKSQALAFVLSGLFTIIRVFVGLACWAVEFAFRFPLLRMLAGPAQKVSDAYESTVVDTLGLKGLLLSWAFVFGLVMVMRGKVGKGLGEIVLTLLIAAFAASAFVRPDYLLAQQGPLVATQEGAAEVAQLTVNSYDWGGKVASAEPCASLAGGAELKCLERERAKPVSAAEVARPIQESVTNALVVKPFMLLQWGRILDPAKASDKKAYAVHLRLVSGNYLTGQDGKEDPCDKIDGPAGEFCESDGHKRDAVLPPLTPGNALLETPSPVLTEEDQQLAAALTDMEKAGPVGKAAAEYAKKPTWWRAGGAVLLLIAALLICAMLLSAVIVLLGTQAADVAAATGGVVAFVLGMLPGPSRQAVWKWLAVFAISMLSTFAICMFIPFFGIAVDAILTNGPDLMIERILLLDVMALVGLAFHRRLLSGASSFGNRMAMRMRYAKIGGSHLPGDSSEIGAALAMNLGGQGGAGLGMGLLGRPSGAAHMLGMRHGLLRSVAAMADGAGQPIDGGRLLGEAAAEGSRGMAPLMLGLAGGRLALRGAYGALIGRRPQEEDESVKLLRLIAKGKGPGPGGGGEPGASGSSGGPGGPGGGADSMVVNRKTGEILHDPTSDRPLIGPRVHDRAMRFRGYRIASRTARVGYGATLGAPRNVKAGARAATAVTRDAQTQLRVAANQVREDAGEWASAGRATAAGIDHVSQRAAATWQAHDPTAPVRTAARNAAATAIIATGPTTAATASSTTPTGPGAGNTSATRQEDAAVDARRRVFDALMRAQRTGWDSEPSWGGDPE
ncbi:MULTISPECIES: hypothetical protein [unclassified Streptomyces]|uniref:hypothetical protein n=1 Tax=unclassified Streptomyces TaxID=2593676 RepID=UPI002E28CC92|nr:MULTISPECIES: hypothetical protein [unclassified Streptomyces]